MIMNAFDILMVIALGSLSGTGIALTLGFVAKKQGSATVTLTRSDVILNVSIVFICSFISIGILNWTSLVYN
jgi:hypothetical protein